MVPHAYGGKLQKQGGVPFHDQQPRWTFCGVMFQRHSGYVTFLHPATFCCIYFLYHQVNSCNWLFLQLCCPLHPSLLFFRVIIYRYPSVTRTHLFYRAAASSTIPILPSIYDTRWAELLQDTKASTRSVQKITAQTYVVSKCHLISMCTFRCTRTYVSPNGRFKLQSG